jgi:hypothetical protein
MLDAKYLDHQKSIDGLYRRSSEAAQSQSRQIDEIGEIKSRIDSMAKHTNVWNAAFDARMRILADNVYASVVDRAKYWAIRKLGGIAPRSATPIPGDLYPEFD